MAINFLFDGSEASKSMVKTAMFYCDEGFQILPPSYLSPFFRGGSPGAIAGMKELEEYEGQLDAAIDFVKKNTLKELSSRDRLLFDRFIREYVDYFKSDPKHADNRLECGENGLTYINLIAPGLLDAFREEVDPLRLNTFKYRLSVNNCFAISLALEPGNDIVTTESARRIIASIESRSQIRQISPAIQNTISILLPNYSRLSLVDTMELKLQAKDALDEMNGYLSSVLSAFDGDAETLKLHLQNQVEPAIRGLEGKIRGLRIGLAQKILSELKDPTSYTPLIISLIPEAPPAVAAGASLALIASETALDLIKQRQEIKSEPLYCIYKLRRLSAKKVNGKGRRVRT